mmetsp:Transcript_25050/g.78943  ORF Transcript_25050/g.78943 Transcript_25050/m.78943 type:complete len:81 (-) Transcript_25050:9-251(-)
MDQPGLDPKEHELWAAMEYMPSSLKMQMMMFPRTPIKEVVQEYVATHRMEIAEMKAKKEAEMRAWWEAEQKRQAMAAAQQ